MRIRNKKKISFVLLLVMLMTAIMPLMALAEGGSVTPSAPTVQHIVTVDSTIVTLYVGNVSQDGTSQLKYLYSDGNMSAHALDTIRNSGLLDSDYTSILPTEAGQVAVTNNSSVSAQDFFTDAGVVAAWMFPTGTTTDTSGTLLYNETKYNELVSSAQTLVSAENTSISEYSSNYNERKTAFEADLGNAGLDYTDVESYCPPVVYTAEPSYPTDGYILVDNVGNTGSKEAMFDGQNVSVSTVEVGRNIIKIFNTSADVVTTPVVSNVVSNLEELQTALNTDSISEVIVTNAITLPNGTSLDGKGKTVRVEKPYVKEDGSLEESPSTTKVFNIESGSNVTIRNMTVMGGQVSGSAISTTGNLTMENVNVVRSNRGLDNDGGIVILKNCNFSLNVCQSAGAIWTGSGGRGKLILDGCSFTQNRSNGGSGMGGGAIGVSSSYLYANNTIFANNATQEIGGAINIYGGNVYLMNCTVSGNCTSNSANRGGGIGKNGGVFHAVNSIFVDNYANISGDKVRSDIGIYSEANGSLNNCVYSKIQGSMSSINNCKIDESNTTASTYTDNGIMLSDGTTSVGFSHPTLTAGTNSYAKHVIIKSTGNAATGGTNTYFDYSDTSNIKMGYGESSSITGLGGLSAPTIDKKVTTYYEGGSRASGVIGASGADGEIAPAYTGIAVGTTTGGKWSCPELFASNEDGAANMTVETGKTVILTATPDTDYKFVGWYEGVIGSSSFVEGNTDTLISSEASYTMTITSPLIIRAVFAPISYHTVSFMDGTTELSTQPVADGGHATRPTTNPVKDTYRFVDWYADSTLTTKFNFATATITQDTLIYAKFVPTPVYPQYTGDVINSYNVTSDVVTLYVGDVTENGTSQVKYLYTDKEVDTATLTEIGKILSADYTAILPTEAGQIKASNNSNYAVDSTYTSASAVATANWAGTVTDTSSTVLYNEIAFNNMVTAAQREVLAEKLAEEDNLDGWTQRKNEWEANEQAKEDADPYYAPVSFPEVYVKSFDDSTTYPTDSYFIADNKGTATTDYIIRNGAVAQVDTYPLGRTIVKVVNTSANVIPLPKLVGNSVLRTNASTATIKFNTDVVGTYYYVVTNSSTAPTAENIKAETTGVHSSGATTVGTNTVNLNGLTTGAQYAYVVVEQDERYSNVLKIEMPYDVYYFDDFEAYQENAYISSGVLSPISQVHNGTGNENQKVTNSITEGKMLSLSSSGWASDQIITWDNMIPTAGKYIFEGDVCTQYSSSETNGWLLRFTLTNGSYGNPNKEAGIHFEKGKIYEATLETTPVKDSFEKDTWYHIRLELYPEESLYDIYIDGEKVAEGLTMPSGLNRLALSAGHGYTAYYDNLKYYVDPSYIPTPEVLGSHVYRTNASSAKVKFHSKCAGTYYYQVTNSKTAPSADSIKSASTGVFGHDSASSGTNVINIDGLASGEQYVHILVANHDNNSNIITIDMPYDVYYADNFDSYDNDKKISGTDGIPEYTLQYNGTGDANQKVITAEQPDSSTGKVLQLQGSNNWASDVRHTFAADDKQYVVFEANIKPVSGSAPGGVNFGSSSAGGRWTGAICGASFDQNNKFKYGKNDVSHYCDTDLTYILGNWYNLKVILDNTNDVYYVCVNGNVIGDAYEADPATPEWFSIGGGNIGTNTIYYDDVKAYTTDTLNMRTVTFMDGETELLTKPVTDGGHVTRPTTDPTKESYRFVNWYADATFTNKFDFANATIIRDTTVYAKFSPTSKYPSNSGSIFNSYDVSSNVVTLYVGDVARDGTSQMKYLYTDEEVDTATLTEMAKILPSEYTAILPSTAGQIAVSNKSGVTVDGTFKAAKDVVNNISIGASSYTISDTSSTNILYDETSFSNLVTASQTEITAERSSEEDNLEAWNERKAEWDAVEQIKADEDPSYTKKDFPEIYIHAFNDSTTYPTDSYFIADNKGTSDTVYKVMNGVLTQVDVYPLGRTIIKVVNTSANVVTSSLSAISEKVDSLDKESTIYAGEIFVDGTSQMQYLYSSDVSNYRNVFESIQTSFNGTAFQGLVPTLTEDSETSGLAYSSAHQDEMNSNWTNSSYVANQYFEGTVGTETNGNLYDSNSTFKSNIDTAEASHQAEMTTPIAANKRVFSTRGVNSSYEYRLIGDVYRRVITISFKIEATTVIYTKVDVTSPTYYDLWVGDTRVSSANASNVLKNTGDATVVYDVETNTLTLNGATITGGGDEVSGYGIRYTGSDTLNIVANGTNVVSDTGTRTTGSAGLVIGGPVGDWTAPSVNSNVNIVVNEGATLTISGGTATGGSYPGSYGICSWNGRGNITVSGSGDLTVNAGTSTYTYGITTYGELIVNSTGKVNVSSPDNVYYGIGVNTADVTINSGTVNVVSGNAERVSQAISTRDMSYVNPAGGNITINGGTATATSGTVSLSGGTSTYDKSYSNAIYAEKNIIVNGGTIEAKTMATSGDEIYVINKAPTFASGIDALAGTNANGTNPVAYNSDDNATYKYFRTPATIWTVSFETFGGSTIADQRIVDGKKAAQPSTNPSKEDGYEFFGWCSNENMSTAFDFNQAITGNTTVYAGYYKDMWVDNTVDKSVATIISEVQVKETITGEESTYEAFNENVNTTYGSNAASEEITAKINSARSAAETFMTNNGYTNKSVTNTTSVTTDYDHRVYPSAVYEYDSTLKCIKRTHIANGDYARNTTYKMIYSAEYTKPSYDVSFMDGTTVLFTQPVVEGGKASVPTTTPTKENWEFDAWCADTTLTTPFNFDSTITGPTSVYVRWKPSYKDVTLLLTDGMTWDESSLTEDQLLEINLLVYRGELVVEQDENDPTIEHYKNRDGKELFMTTPTGGTRVLTFGEGITYQDNIVYELTEEDKALVADSMAELFINKLTLSFGNPPLVYMVIDGANQTHTKQSGLDMTVTANGEVSKFKELRTDNTVIGENDRIIVSGSTIATLKSAYLDSLAEGTHTLTFIYVDGECSTNFTIAKAETKPEKTEKTVEATLVQTGGGASAPASPAPADKSKLLNTGDNIYIWIALLVASTACFIGSWVMPKKK